MSALTPQPGIMAIAPYVPGKDSVEGKETRAHNFDQNQQLRQRRTNFARWESNSTSFETENDVFNELMKTGIGDFHALQIPNGNQHVIAAGIPWFATMFGRDSIIAAYQSLSLNPQLAVDTLRVLARYQGKEYNDWRDEEPGKIAHEYRDGEMTRDGEMPWNRAIVSGGSWAMAASVSAGGRPSSSPSAARPAGDIVATSSRADGSPWR